MEGTKYDKTEMLISKQLVAGNHDSLILFGVDEQQKISECSKMLAALVVSSDGQLDYLIHDILTELDEFQNEIEAKSKFSIFQTRNYKRKKLIKKYNNVLVYIDRMELLLKLQEAQLIKDMKVLREIEIKLRHGEENLKDLIAHGNECYRTQNRKEQDEILNDWYIRLSKRLEDLEISRVVILQNIEQIQLMQGNNEQLVGKILSAVSGTIPIWRTQITILLGVEKINRNQEVYDKVALLTQSAIKNNKSNNRKISEGDIDVKKLSDTNDKLKESIKALSILENENDLLKNNLTSQLR